MHFDPWYRYLLWEDGRTEKPVMVGRNILPVLARRAAPARKALPALGVAMHFDRRRIPAPAVTRLRAKLKYRPVVLELLPNEFTLTGLQRTVEAISGRHLHQQNFRRGMENTALVEPAGVLSTQTGGRLAAAVGFRSEVLPERPAPGFGVRARC